MAIKKEYLIGGGIGLLALVFMMRGSGGNTVVNDMGATVATLAGANATNIQFASIAAENQQAADQRGTERYALTLDLFDKTVNNRTIASQTINMQNNIAVGALTSGSIIAQSFVASDLAKFLGVLNADVEKLKITDTNKTDIRISEITAASAKDLANVAKAINRSNNRYGSLDNAVSSAGSIVKSIF